LSLLSPSANKAASAEDRAGFLACQELAFRGVKAVESLLVEGMSEKQAADLLDTWLLDHGVSAFFHKSFVWFGERTRFVGVRTYWDYQPGRRVLRPGEAVILDVAPINRGYIADIGYSTSFGAHPEMERARGFLRELYEMIPRLCGTVKSGGELCDAIDREIGRAGYDNIHARYPFSVLGHRVHRVTLPSPRLAFIHFGWQSYWEFLSRGLFGQLLNRDFRGDLVGLWAIEPHVGLERDGLAFGAKFEEILVVDHAGEGGARWLAERPSWI
jgi:hypothetical protein